MANNYNTYKKKTSQNGNFNPNIKKKKKLSFYLIIGAIIFCILGAILGTTAFVENRIAKADTNYIDTQFNFNNTNFNGDSRYSVSNGVSTNINLPDYKNFGWAGWNANKGLLSILNYKDTPVGYNFAIYTLNSLSSDLSITPFITFNEPISIEPQEVIRITLACSITTDSEEFLESFSFYFLGSEQINLTQLYLDNEKNEYDYKVISFTYVNNTSQTQTFSSYRLNLVWSTNDTRMGFQLWYCNIVDMRLLVGYADGYQDGLNKGLEDGFNDGYGKGYQEGSKTKNSFFNLFSALIDVPMDAFTNLFNFDVFGQNLKNFFLAIFTFAVVIKIVQLLL